MARVNKAKKKAAHEYLVQQELKALGKKNVKALAEPSSSGEVKMRKNEQRETRRDKIARKKRETKQRKAPNKETRMEVDVSSRLRVKKTAIHK